MECPKCRTDLILHFDTGVGPGGKRGPEPGDYTLCMECETPLQVLIDGRLKKLAWGALPAPCYVELKRILTMKKLVRVMARARWN